MVAAIYRRSIKTHAISPCYRQFGVRVAYIYRAVAMTVQTGLDYAGIRQAFESVLCYGEADMAPQQLITSVIHLPLKSCGAEWGCELNLPLLLLRSPALPLLRIQTGNKSRQ